MAQRFLCRENGCFSDNGMALNIAKCGRGAMLKGVERSSSSIT